MDPVNHSETLDFLSSSWCNFAIQALQPELQDRSSIFARDPTMKAFQGDTSRMEKTTKIDDANYMKSIPSWKSNDLKSWIWMQQAMQPEVNYSARFQKKRFHWRMPFGDGSIKEWVKEMKENRKKEKRLQRAEVHAAVSIAGLAAALAAIAEENSKGKLKLEDKDEQNETRKVALASATALVASHCAQVAQLLGAKKVQISSVISSALRATSISDILTLTAAASTSLRGAATLKGRAGWKNRALNGTPVLPIEMDNTKADDGLDLERCKSVLAKGAILTIETADGRSMKRLVSLHLNNQAKVILRISKRNLLNVITSKKECLVLSLHAEQYKDSGRDENDTRYQVMLTTRRGKIKLDMADDYQRYRMWTTTINQMLTISPSLTSYNI